jgi:hypothetical protein
MLGKPGQGPTGRGLVGPPPPAEAIRQYGMGPDTLAPWTV